MWFILANDESIRVQNKLMNNFHFFRYIQTLPYRGFVVWDWSKSVLLSLDDHSSTILQKEMVIGYRYCYMWFWCRLHGTSSDYQVTTSVIQTFWYLKTLPVHQNFNPEEFKESSFYNQVKTIPNNYIKKF